MEVNSTEKWLKNIAGFLGTIQGFSWIIMSIRCINIYIQGIGDNDFPSSYMDYVEYMWYRFFLIKKPAKQLQLFSRGISQEAFFGFACIYLILDIVWLIASLNVLAKNVIKLKIIRAVKAWSIITILVCILDFILVVILGVDYSKCLKTPTRLFYNVIIKQAVCTTGIIPILVIVAKGFVLWVVNFVFAIILFKMAKQLEQGGHIIERFAVTTTHSPPMAMPPVSNEYFRYPQPVPLVQSEYWDNARTHQLIPQSSLAMMQQNFGGHVQYPPPSYTPPPPLNGNSADPQKWNNERPFPPSTPPNRY